MENLAPVALFVYKRLRLTQQTVESLKKNPEAAYSRLFIFSDAAKTEKDLTAVNEVREYINTITGFKSVTVIESPGNKGLANSIISGVTRIVDEYGRIIVLEDDMLVSPWFLRYMNDALKMYEDEEKVISVHAYIYPVKEELPETFFLKGADCWGWGTWKRGWALFNPDAGGLINKLVENKLEYDFNLSNTIRNMKMLRNQYNGRIDSWAIRWHASALIAGKYTLYPGKPLVQNIGVGEQATHTKTSLDIYKVKLANEPINLVKLPVEENIFARKQVELFNRKVNPGLLSRIVKKISGN